MRGFEGLISLKNSCHCEEPRRGDVAILSPTVLIKRFPRSLRSLGMTAVAFPLGGRCRASARQMRGFASLISFKIVVIARSRYRRNKNGDVAIVSPTVLRKRFPRSLRSLGMTAVAFPLGGRCRALARRMRGFASLISFKIVVIARSRYQRNKNGDVAIVSLTMGIKRFPRSLRSLGMTERGRVC